MLKRVLIIIVLIFLCFRIYDLLTLSEGEIWGTYINNNNSPILEGPLSTEFGIDTLYTYGDNRFKNNCWGVGNYQLESKIWYSNIYFTYRNQNNWGEYQTRIINPAIGDFKIWLNKDLNFHYKRIKQGR